MPSNVVLKKKLVSANAVIADQSARIAELESKLKDSVPQKVAISMVKAGYIQEMSDKSFICEIKKTFENKMKIKKWKEKQLKIIKPHIVNNKTKLKPIEPKKEIFRSPPEICSRYHKEKIQDVTKQNNKNLKDVSRLKQHLEDIEWHVREKLCDTYQAKCKSGKHAYQLHSLLKIFDKHKETRNFRNTTLNQFEEYTWIKWTTTPRSVIDMGGGFWYKRDNLFDDE